MYFWWRPIWRTKSSSREKAANVSNKTRSRHLGMTGPENINRLPGSVYEVDCDDFNSRFDRKGHSYFLRDSALATSPLYLHMADAIAGERVTPGARCQRLVCPPL